MEYGMLERNQEDCKKIGRVIEGALQSEKGIDLKEHIAKAKGVAKEDLTIAEDSVYTTAIAGFIEKKLTPDLEAEKVIRKISVDQKGADSVKVPVRNALITASDLPDSGAVSYDTGSYDSTTITLRYSYAAQKITHELLKFANVDLLAENLGEIGDAIARKVDSDIISAFQSAGVTANGNLTNLGATTTVTFDSLVDAKKSAKTNNAKPDVILVSEETEAAITKLDEFTSGNNITGALSFQGGNGQTFPVISSILGMRLVVSQQVDDDDIFLIDTARCGYLARKNGVEVFDGRVSGSLAYEVIGAHAYGVSVVQPKAVMRVRENN